MYVLMYMHMYMINIYLNKFGNFNEAAYIYIILIFFWTVHHSIDLFHLPTLMHNYFIH